MSSVNCGTLPPSSSSSLSESFVLCAPPPPPPPSNPQDSFIRLAALNVRSGGGCRRDDICLPTITMYTHTHTQVCFFSLQKSAQHPISFL